MTEKFLLSSIRERTGISATIGSLSSPPAPHTGLECSSVRSTGEQAAFEVGGGRERRVVAGKEGGRVETDLSTSIFSSQPIYM